MTNETVPKRKARETARAAPSRGWVRPAKQPRAIAKQAMIVEAALRHFAEHGYEAARVEDLAKKIGIAKGSIFQHFKTKEGLFLETYKKAVRSLPKYMDAPPEAKEKGFFAVVRFWLQHTEHLIHEDWVPFRVAILGDYGADVHLKREIRRFLEAEDPYATTAFVRWGIERGEIRTDVDLEMVVHMVDWMTERFQDALLAEELDPGLFRRHGGKPERTQVRIDQFIELLRGAIGARRG